MYIAITIISLLLILWLTGQKSVHNEILIQASPQQVWEVLLDMDKYGDWNPVMTLLEGEVNEGYRVKYRFSQDENNSSEIGATVIELTAPRLLNQKGGIPLVLTFNHKYVLQPVDTRTKVIIHEEYRGIGVNFWNPAPVEEAYRRLNEALKARVELLVDQN